MQSKSILDYISFGTELRYLQDAQDGWGIHNVEHGWMILGNIQSFLDQKAGYK
jgi:hypothetical protein